MDPRIGETIYFSGTSSFFIPPSLFGGGPVLLPKAVRLVNHCPPAHASDRS